MQIYRQCVCVCMYVCTRKKERERDITDGCDSYLRSLHNRSVSSDAILHFADLVAPTTNFKLSFVKNLQKR
ncbi:MAG: putative adenine nucleotide alpha hydrolase (AANH) superfamily ATPase [Bacillariaceae sp.]|jgi:predicted adenine nucleotide alpha hydrolase (AANH) superfamily ATPase